MYMNISLIFVLETKCLGNMFVAFLCCVSLHKPSILQLCGRS